MSIARRFYVPRCRGCRRAIRACRKPNSSFGSEASLSNTPVIKSSTKRLAQGDDDSGDSSVALNASVLKGTVVTQSFGSLYHGASLHGSAGTDADATGNAFTGSFPLGQMAQALVALAAISSSPVAAAASLLIDNAADRVIDAAEPTAFTISGLPHDETGTVTLADVSNQQVVVHGAEGNCSSNLPAFTKGTITSSLSAADPIGHATTSTGNAVPFTHRTLRPSLSVNAANPADVIFTVPGLESDYSGKVTFTDTTGKSDVVPIGSDGTYSANLSSLTNGTITYVMTVTDPTGSVITVDPTATLGDSSPAGRPQLPNLLNGYAAPPPWKVAGVDYAVGVRSGTALLNPSTISMSGVSVNTSTHTVTVTGNNVTLNGYDFSLNGGWEVYINGASNTVIENCNFVVGSSNLIPIYSDTSASNLTVKDCTFNGGGASERDSALIYFRGYGTFVAEYDLFENAPSDAIDLNSASTLTPTVSYNLFYDLGLAPGAHADTVQFVGNAVNNYVFTFNTVYQPATSVGGMEGVQVEAQGNNGASVDNSTITNNTLIAPMGAAQGNTMSYVFALLSDSNAPNDWTVNNTLIENNYIDPTGAYGTFYPLTYSGGPTNTTISNNVDMTTGGFIQANNSKAPPTMVTEVLASPSSGVEVAGHTITLTVSFTAVVTVSGVPTLRLNDGGTATYMGGSDTNTLTFKYTVSASDTVVAALAITQVDLSNGATIKDRNGNTPNFAGALKTPSGLQKIPPPSSGVPH